MGPGNQVKDIYVRETDNTVTFNQNFLFEIRVDTRHDVVSPDTAISRFDRYLLACYISIGKIARLPGYFGCCIS